MLKRLLLSFLAFSALAAAAEESHVTSSSTSASSTAKHSSSSSPSPTITDSPSATESLSKPTTGLVTEDHTAPSRTTTGAMTWTVTVGAVGTFAYEPDTIYNATKGDTVLFQFNPQNHSVVKMDPEHPCVPYNDIHRDDPDMWWSGFKPTDSFNDIPTFQIHLNDSEPLWFYCSALDSCIPHGMVGVINPPNSTILAAVKKQATQADYVLSPGEIPPNEGTLPTSASSPAATSSSPAATSSSSSSSGGSSGLSGGAIAGIVIGAVVAVALVGLLFFFVGRRKKTREMNSVPSTGDGYSAAAGPPGVMSPIPQMGQMQEHPPLYQQEPRYSYVPPGSPGYVPPGSPGWAPSDAVKAGHLSQQSAVSDDQNPHRLSELASQNYDPVEMYTPGLPNTTENPNSPDAARGERNADQQFEQHQERRNES